MAGADEFDCCLTCASLRFRDVEPGQVQTYCSHDGMAVDEAFACSKFEPGAIDRGTTPVEQIARIFAVPAHLISETSPATYGAAGDEVGREVDKPSLGVSALDLGAQARACAPLSGEG